MIEKKENNISTLFKVISGLIIFPNMAPFHSPDLAISNQKSAAISNPR